MDRKIFSFVAGMIVLTALAATAFARSQSPASVRVIAVKPVTTRPLHDMKNLDLPPLLRRIVGNRHLSKTALAKLRQKLIKTGVLPNPDQRPPIPHVGRPPALARPLAVHDSVLQSRLPQSSQASPRDFTSPLASFDGMGVSTNGSVGSLLPHTSVAAGMGNYVAEMVTLSGWPSGGSYFSVYDKSGNLVMGPVNLDNLWPDGQCNSSIYSVGFGEGQVIYDQLAQRWILVQIAGYRGNSLASNECVAVSQTSDPTGTYYVYDIPLVAPNPWPIFPYFIRSQSFGLWSNAYYASFNLYHNSATEAFPFSGVVFMALQRSAMLAGQPAQMVMIKSQADDSAVSVLPASLDGETPPPAGAPGLFAGYVSPFQSGSAGYALELWQMNVDWANPADSTLVGPSELDVAPFNDGICYFTTECIPEPAPGIGLSAVADRLMSRLAYRNLGDRQTLVVNQTVAGDGSGEPPAGIRWYELDAPSGSIDANQWTVSQQGTFLPADSISRWMGSIAMDASGNIALGYSLSGPNTYPSIAYTGHLASDPAGEMTQPETILKSGSGVETAFQNDPDWGDISTMATDPSDGCTFWYAGEYLTGNGTYNWSTHIGAFKFANCTAAPVGNLTGTVTDAASGDPIAGATVAVGTSPNLVQTKTDNNGHYTILLPAASYPETASRFAYVSQSSTVTVIAGSTTTQDFALPPAPTATVSGTVSDGSGQGYGLYAEIKLSTPGFGQIADIWTKPSDGSYHVSLPLGSDYKLSVTPYFDGYNPGSATITALSGDTTQNFPLTVTSVCAAPGYHSVGFSEDFNGSFPPAGWQVVNTGRGSPPYAQGWETNTYWGRGNWTGGTGTAASAGPLPVPFGQPFDTSLITSPISATSLPPGMTTLRYKANYIHGFQDALDLDISTDDGGSWRTISHWTTNHGTIYGTPGENETVDLGGYLPASGDFLLRWHYYSPLPFGNWYAQLDDVSMAACAPISGGLVLGEVTDRNTGDGIARAEVADDRGARTRSFDNAPDGNLPPGYYILFSPAGTRTVTVSYPGYANGEATVNVAANSVNLQDFALAAGRLAAVPGSYDLHVSVGAQKDEVLTVENTGSAPAHFRIETINAPAVSSAGRAEARGKGAPLQIIHCNRLSSLSTGQTQPANCGKGQAPALAASAASSAWQAIADYPSGPIMDNAVATDPAAAQNPGSGEIYSVDGTDGTNILASGYAYDPITDTWREIASNRIPREAPAAAFIGGKLYLAGGWGNPTGRLEIYDPASNTWTVGASNPAPLGGGSAAAVVNGKLYVVGGCSNETGLAGTCGFTTVEAYDPTTNGWSKVADYPHPVSWEACGGIGEPGQQKLYCAGGTSGTGTTYRGGYVYDPATNKWTPIDDMPIDRWGGGYTAVNGELLFSGGAVRGGTELTNTGYAYSPASGSWSPLPNALYALYRGGSACGFYRIGGSTGGISPTSVGEVLPGYGACGTSPIPWLAIAPSAGTVAAGDSAAVTLTFDGTGRQPFTTSQAQLALVGDTPPYPAKVPLTVHWDPQPVDLVVTGTSIPDRVNNNSDLYYDLTVTNKQQEGHGGATAVTLDFPLPTGTSFEAGNSSGACQASAGTVSCALGDLAPDASAKVTIVVKVALAGTLSATFTAMAQEPQSPVGDNQLTLETTVIGSADLALAAPAALTLNEGASATLTFTLTNSGPDPATEVTLVAPVTGAISYRSATASQGRCTVGGSTLDCDLGDIAKGGTASVSLAVSGSQVGTGTVMAQAATSSTDPESSNDTAQTQVTVRATSNGGGGNGGGGGGGFGGFALLALLGIALAAGLLRRRQANPESDRRTNVMNHEWSRKMLTGIAAVTLAMSGLLSGEAALAGTSAVTPNFGQAAGVPGRTAMAPQSSLALLKRATLVGPHAAASPIRLTIGLKLRNVADLRQFLRDVQNPRSPRYRKFLTPAEFTARYGPTEAQIAAVVAFLKRWHIRVGSVSSNRILIHTSGSTTAYEHALQIGINDYTLNGRSFFSTTDRPRIPAALAGIVANVIGLNNGVELQPHHRLVPHAFASPRSSAEAPPPATSAYFFPAQIATAYEWPSIMDPQNGAGVTTAIMTAASSDLNPDDYEIFWSELGLPDHTVQTISVDGDEGITGGTLETVLDIEWSGAMAPGEALDVYIAADPLLTTFLDMYNRVVSDDNTQVVTTSWGAPEPAWGSLAETANEIFAEGAALGMTFFAAAGDNGSADAPFGPPTADFPSASPYVTAANGTELTTDITGDYLSETAWNLTGGAISQVFAEPDWQVGPGVPRNGFRNNSDVAMNAGSLHPYMIHFEDIWGGVYGTSAVAPQLAGLFAIAVSQNGGDSLGQANELIYNDANVAGNYASDFHDVTSGCNGSFCATSFWDHPTGWGSPRATSLLSHLGVQGPKGTLSGTVTNAATGQPIAGAFVTVTPDRYPRKTKSDGTYSYLLPVGDYTVTVAAFGYSKQSVQVRIDDGDNVEQDFQLAAAPNATVSGKVTDASGHGWGLYAQVTVTVPLFGTVATVFTDPATGAYSVNLPQGGDYSFNVLTYFDGYDSGTAEIDDLSGDVTQDFPLAIIPACTAPGYRSVTGLNEDFNGGFPPTGWQSTNDYGGSPVVWKLNSDWEQGGTNKELDNWTGGTGTAATAYSGDSNFYLGHFDTSLITPPIPVSTLGANPMLRFALNYQNNAGDVLDVGISTDGGSHWTRMEHFTTDQGHSYGLPGTVAAIDLRPYVPAAARQIRIRWRYYDLVGGFDWYAEVDDVRVGGCDPISGGLVLGQVTDENTGKGIVRATVADDTGAQTKTFVIPPDANLPAGSYILFVPSGPRLFGASYPDYATAQADVNVAPNSVSEQDFALAAARIHATPGAYDVNVTVGSQKTLRLAVGNTGLASARFWIKTINAPPTATQGAAAGLPWGHAPEQVIRCKHLSTLSYADWQPADCQRGSEALTLAPAAASTPWVALAPYPTEAILDNAVAIDPAAAQYPGSGRIYSIDGNPCNCPPVTNSYVYDPATNTWSPIASNTIAREAPVAAFIGGKLYLVNGWDTHPIPQPVGVLEIYDPGSNAWSLGPSNPAPEAGGSAVAVMNGKMYVVGGCGPSGTEAYCGDTTVEVYDPVRQVWSGAAPYPHPVAWAACGVIGLPGSEKLYCAGGESSAPGSAATTTYADGYVYDPQSNTWSPIAGMPTDRFGAGYAVADGELLISGGAAFGGGAIVNTGFAYNPASDSWGSIPNSLYSLYRGGSACGFYRIGGSTGGFTPVGDSEAWPGLGPCGYSPIPWLTLAPPMGTVGAAPSASAIVALTIDGTGQLPFTSSRAQLQILGQTPYGTQFVPLTVHWDPQPVDLVLTGSEDRDTLHKGDVLTYTLQVTNREALNHGAATKVILNYPLRAGIAFVKGGDSEAPCTASTGSVNCNLGEMDPGADKTLTIVVQVTQAGELTSTFTVTAAEPQEPAGDNEVTIKATVIGTADVGVSATGASVPVGNSGTVQLNVANAGPDTATDVTLKLSAGSNVKLNSASAEQGSCSASGANGFSCDLGEVASGATVTVDVTAFGAYAGTATLTGQVSTSATDSNPGNDTAQATVTIAVGGGGGGGGTGGGGGFGWLALAALLALVFTGVGMRRRG